MFSARINDPAQMWALEQVSSTQYGFLLMGRASYMVSEWFVWQVVVYGAHIWIRVLISFLPQEPSGARKTTQQVGSYQLT